MSVSQLEIEKYPLQCGAYVVAKLINCKRRFCHLPLFQVYPGPSHVLPGQVLGRRSCILVLPQLPRETLPPSLPPGLQAMVVKLPVTQSASQTYGVTMGAKTSEGRPQISIGLAEPFISDRSFDICRPNF